MGFKVVLAQSGPMFRCEAAKESFMMQIECIHGNSAKLFGSAAYESLLRRSGGLGSGVFNLNNDSSDGGCPFRLEYIKMIRADKFEKDIYDRAYG